MAKVDDLLRALKEGGHRLTPQRVMILTAIASGRGHMTAEQIYEKVKRSYPYIDIATVYRTIQLLRRHRLLVEIDLGSGTLQYEISRAERHHHMVCRGCAQTFDIDHRRFMEPVRTALLEEFGFEADIDHFAIFGLCKACRAKGTA